MFLENTAMQFTVAETFRKVVAEFQRPLIETETNLRTFAVRYADSREGSRFDNVAYIANSDETLTLT